MRSHLHLAFAAFSFIAIVHFGCSPAAPAESPESTGTAENTSGPSSQDDPAAEPESQSEPGAGSKPRTSPQSLDDRVPDDYALTNGDCNVLGKQYAAAIRADQMAGISDKLKDPQRAQVLQNIDEVAQKMAGNWIESCQTSLVGQITDPKSLKCALQAPSVKEFDACLNSSPAAPKK
jgi:hypothetical protein